MNLFGYTSGDISSLLILAGIIFVIWLVLKFVFKLTMGFMKTGCLIAVLIMAAAALLVWLI